MFKNPGYDAIQKYDLSCPTHKPTPPCHSCESGYGNSVNVNICKGDCEIRADLEIARVKSVRIWGQVRDCDGKPVKNALIKLLKVNCSCGEEDLTGVSHTFTDCNGFYQLDVSGYAEGEYKVLAGLSATGEERVIDHCASCNPCEPCDKPSKDEPHFPPNKPGCPHPFPPNHPGPNLPGPNFPGNGNGCHNYFPQ